MQRFTPRQHTHRKQQGQSLMEFALILPLLLMLLLGTFDFARAVFMYAQLSNGVREGARYGSVTGLDESDPQFLDCEGIRAATVRAYGVPLTPDQITIEYDNGNTLYLFTCDSRPGLSAIQMGDRIRVTARAQIRFITPVLSSFPPLSVTLTSARTVLRGGTVVPPGSS